MKYACRESWEKDWKKKMLKTDKVLRDPTAPDSKIIHAYIVNK